MKHFIYLPLFVLFISVAGCRSTTLVQVQAEFCADAPICLGANDLSLATGQPSLVMMSSGATHIPVWSLSGMTTGQSVAGVIPCLPRGCAAVKVEIVVITTEAASAGAEDVYRCSLSQMVEGAAFTSGAIQSTPVRAAVPTAPFQTRTLVLESYYPVNAAAPLCVRIQREPADPANTFTRPAGLVAVKVTPLKAPAPAYVVQNVHGYNSWPMLQALGTKLVCVYSRGSAHTIGEDARATYARTSTDNGRTWSPETVVAHSPGYGDVPVGKGLDAQGAMLLWVRRAGPKVLHDLYRTTDGVTFTHVATPQLAVTPVQISDVFTVPKVGLMALWFSGSYKEGSDHAWGTVMSADNGATWKQTTIESGLSHAQWPTELAAVYLGNDRILAIARTEQGGSSSQRAQYQIVSTDSGKTWTRKPTNIGNVVASTPSLILDAQTGLLSLYYYQRGRGLLHRRVVEPNRVFDQPLAWPASEVVATGSAVTFDAGNVNATAINGTHYLSFYSGAAPDTAVMVAAQPAPTPRSNDEAQAKNITP